MQLVVAELTIAFVMGTLLCLDRTQRVAFILSIAFNVGSEEGAEILGMSPEAFRKTLSRARANLHEYMQGICGFRELLDRPEFQRAFHLTQPDA